MAAPGEVASGTAEELLGWLTSRRGPVERSISDFVKHALDGNVYLKITTVQTPQGRMVRKIGTFWYVEIIFSPINANFFSWLRPSSSIHLVPRTTAAIGSSLSTR